MDLKDKELVKKTLIEGVNTDFWQILCEVLDDNLENLDRVFLQDVKDFEGLLAEECKIRMQVYLEKKKYLAKLKDLPRDIVESFNEVDQSQPDLDVYKTAKDFLSKQE